MTMRVVYATQTAVIGYTRVSKGTHWPADDPVVLEHPDLFSDDPRYGLSFSQAPPEMAEAPVEQATAAPGERRNLRRPREARADD